MAWTFRWDIMRRSNNLGVETEGAILAARGPAHFGNHDIKILDA